MATEHEAEPDVSEPSVIDKDEKVVLLVEDDPDVSTVTTSQLKRLGYKVYSVANGIEAVEALVSPTTIDFVLTDMILPGGIDGIGVIKETLRARPNIGLLCMSGYAPSQDQGVWLEAQNIKYLNKPFSRAQLGEALNKLRL